MVHTCEICSKFYKSYHSYWNHNKRYHKSIVPESSSIIRECSSKIPESSSTIRENVNSKTFVRSLSHFSFRSV
jgi:hypothetical protein